MPGALKADAFCPKCGRDIMLLARTTTQAVTALEFIHTDGTPDCAIVGKHEDMDRLHARLHK
jgi:hypothetical protein